MFIELTEVGISNKRLVPVQLIRDILPYRSIDGSILRVVGNDATANIEVTQSPAAIRSALLKAGLLLVVEQEDEAEKLVEVQEPSKWPDKAELEYMSFEKLFDLYASAVAKSHSGEMETLVVQQCILAVANERVARAFEQGKAAALPAQSTKVEKEISLARSPQLQTIDVDGLCQEFAMISDGLAEHILDVDRTIYDDLLWQRTAIVAELQRRIDAKPEQVVRLRVYESPRGWFVTDGTIIVTAFMPNKAVARADAEQIIHRFAGPNVRIEWEAES